MTDNADMRGKRILIVEDDAFIALDLEDVFEAAGFKVVGIAASVDAALEIIDSNPIDVAVLDYNLGVETSLDIAHRLDAMGVPFLFLSGQTRTVVLDDADVQPIVLNKPFVPAHLVNETRSLFRSTA